MDGGAKMAMTIQFRGEMATKLKEKAAANGVPQTSIVRLAVAKILEIPGASV